MDTLVSKNGYYGDDMSETALFCENTDNFFDALNVRSMSEGDQKHKNIPMPYRNIDDPRFDWFQNVFLKYLSDWRESIEERSGQFTLNAKDCMFISWQMYQGINISVHEATKYMLAQGMKFVFTESFNQACAEEYFRYQRSAGCWSDNPSISQFSYNDAIRIQSSVVPAIGNTASAHKSKEHVFWSLLDETPLPKRMKQS